MHWYQIIAEKIILKYLKIDDSMLPKKATESATSNQESSEDFYLDETEDYSLTYQDIIKEHFDTAELINQSEPLDPIIAIHVLIFLQKYCEKLNEIKKTNYVLKNKQKLDKILLPCFIVAFKLNNSEKNKQNEINNDALKSNLNVGHNDEIGIIEAWNLNNNYLTKKNLKNWEMKFLIRLQGQLFFNHSEIVSLFKEYEVFPKIFQEIWSRDPKAWVEILQELSKLVSPEEAIVYQKLNNIIQYLTEDLFSDAKALWNLDVNIHEIKLQLDKAIKTISRNLPVLPFFSLTGPHFLLTLENKFATEIAKIKTNRMLLAKFEQELTNYIKEFKNQSKNVEYIFWRPTVDFSGSHADLSYLIKCTKIKTQILTVIERNLEFSVQILKNEQPLNNIGQLKSDCLLAYKLLDSESFSSDNLFSYEKDMLILSLQDFSSVFKRINKLKFENMKQEMAEKIANLNSILQESKRNDFSLDKIDLQQIKHLLLELIETMLIMRDSEFNVLFYSALAERFLDFVVNLNDVKTNYSEGITDPVLWENTTPSIVSALENMQSSPELNEDSELRKKLSELSLKIFEKKIGLSELIESLKNMASICNQKSDSLALNERYVFLNSSVTQIQEHSLFQQLSMDDLTKKLWDALPKTEMPDKTELPSFMP